MRRACSLVGSVICRGNTTTTERPIPSFSRVPIIFTSPCDQKKHKRNFSWGTMTRVHDCTGYGPDLESADPDIAGVRSSRALAVIPCGGIRAEPDAQCYQPHHPQDGGGAWSLAV